MSRPLPPEREGVDKYGRIRSESGIARGKGSKTRSGGRINLGLALLSLLRIPGQPLDYDDIAAWCGCSRSYISQLEQDALRKLRRQFILMRQTNPLLSELAEQFFFARTPAIRKETH